MPTAWRRDEDAAGLERFVDAQARGVYDRALGELRHGRKSSHWMWFVFPQLRGLGMSATSQKYGLVSLEQARRYLSHPLLGARLREAADAVNALEGTTLAEVFGSPDDLKFHSSMTLFGRAGPDEPRFTTALERWCGGREDERTLELLGAR